MMMRDHWGYGYVRHLDVADDWPLDSVSATDDGWGEYVLNVHSRHAGRVDEYRDLVEPEIKRYFDRTVR